MKRWHGQCGPMPCSANRPSASMAKRDQRSGCCGQVILVLLVFLTQSDCVLNKESVIDETTMTIRVVKGLVAVLPCTVDPMYTEQFSEHYKVVWVNPLETIISLQDRRILNDDRLSIERNFLRDWNLHIRNVSLTDAGLYKCQINTNPVGTKKVILVVHESPRIIDHTLPTKVEKPEGEMIQLFCNATGTPTPEITWYRIHKRGNHSRERVGNTGDALVIHNISKNCADDYECVAENGVSPSINQTFTVSVLYPPIVTLYNNRLSQQLGKDTALECYVTASPHGTASWKHNNKFLTNDPNHELIVYDSQAEADTVILSVRILRLEPQDYGAYTCEAANSQGTGSGTMMLYELSTTTLPPSTTPSTISSYRPIYSNSDFHQRTHINEKPHDKMHKPNVQSSKKENLSQPGALSNSKHKNDDGGLSVIGANIENVASTSGHGWTWWTSFIFIFTHHLIYS